MPRLVWFPALQATSFWQWSNFLHSRAPLQKRVVRINFDETNVQLFEREIKGHLTKAARKQKRQPRSLKRNTHGMNTKVNLTHIVFVCDDHSVQKVLPQILLVRSKALNEEKCRELESEVTGNIIILRLERAWTIGRIVKEVLIQLRLALREFRETCEFILYADGFRAHITESVREFVSRGRFYYCIVPASLTWALQPCDTHVLAGYKRTLTLLWSKELSRKGRSAMTLQEVVRCINKAVALHLEKSDWKQAFEHVGATGHQNLVSYNTLDKLALQDVVRAEAELPTLGQLQAVFPRATNLPIHQMFPPWL